MHTLQTDCSSAQKIIIVAAVPFSVRNAALTDRRATCVVCTASILRTRLTLVLVVESYRLPQSRKLNGSPTAGLRHKH